jgi:hypothetical protein
MRVQLNEGCYLVNENPKADTYAATIKEMLGTGSKIARIQRFTREEIKVAKAEYKAKRSNSLRNEFISAVVNSPIPSYNLTLRFK